MRLLTPLLLVCVCLLTIVGLTIFGSRMTEAVRQGLELARCGEELDRAAASAVQRNEGKAAIVQDVAAGRMTFRAALARCRVLYREECATSPRGTPDDEWLARNLAMWIHHVLVDGGKLTDARIAHLDPELRRLLRDPRLLDLPQWKPAAPPAVRPASDSPAPLQ